MNKRVRLFSFLLLGGLIFAFFPEHSCADYEQIYDKGVKYIADYEYNSGIKELKKITQTSSAPEGLRIKSYLWISLAKLLGENEEQARAILREMFKEGIGLHYDIQLLPPELVQVAKFMKMYREEENNFLKEREKLTKIITKKVKLARKYIRKGDLYEAKENLDSVLELDPENEEALELLSDIKQDSMEEEQSAERINIEEAYNKAVKAATNYEMEYALGELKKIVVSKNAAKNIKLNAYFWMAYIYLFDGYEDQSLETFKKMMGKGIGTDNIEELPLELRQNVQLMELYIQVKEEFPKEEDRFQMKTNWLLKEARNLYRERFLDESEELVDKILEIDAQKKEAQALKNKIKILKAIRVSTRKKLVEEVYSQAKYQYERGNMMGAVQESYRTLKLNPKHQEAYNLYKNSYRELQKMVGKASEEDKNKFYKGVDYFLEGRFDDAANIFRKLEIPEVNVLLFQSLAKKMEATNNNRAEKYYQKALKTYKKARFRKAQEYLLLSLILNKYNLKALILLEEVRLELQDTEFLIRVTW